LNLHIALDLDGVLLDFSGGLCEAIKTEYDVDLMPEDITDWDLHPVLDPIIGYSWWKWLRERDWLWPNFPAVDGAIGAIDRLRRDGHYLEIVTAKPDWATFAVWQWLGKWRPMVHRVTIVNTKGESKAHATNADILIDDKIENCLEWVESRSAGEAIVFGQPYNTEADAIDSVYRIEGWPATLGLIKELAA
jgi:5'(3')-deoxyribonucleotidase